MSALAGGSALTGGVSALEGVGVVSAFDRVSALAGGGDVGILACTEADPPVNRITDACRGCLVTYPIMHFMLNVCCLHIN